MPRKRPKKRAAAAPHPEREKTLPRVWNIVLYSKEEVQIVGLALSVVQTQLGVPEDPRVMLEQIALQVGALHATADLANMMGGFQWLNSIRHRFAELARAIEEEESR